MKIIIPEYTIFMEHKLNGKLVFIGKGTSEGNYQFTDDIQEILPVTKKQAERYKKDIVSDFCDLRVLERDTGSNYIVGIDEYEIHVAKIKYE